MGCRCLDSRINFSTEALEKLVYEPEWVLENQEEYWSTYPSQKYTRMWAEQVKYTIDYDAWRKTVDEWNKKPETARSASDFLKNTEKIVKGREIFLDKALPHVCSYLPPDAILDISVHFTAHIPPRAFAMGEIVINMTATYWNNNPDNILNTMVHELFHVGYGYCRDQWKNIHRDPLFDILENIHNEGICTYVAYTAQDIFPAPDEKDFQFLDNSNEVKQHIAHVNNIISKLGEISEEEFEKLSWDQGVIGRSYYVTGAYMCQVINEKLGKKELIQTLLSGPRSFFETYNKIASRKIQVS